MALKYAVKLIFSKYFFKFKIKTATLASETMSTTEKYGLKVIILPTETQN